MDENLTDREHSGEIAENEEWVLTTDSSILKREPRLATLVLRLGAAVNAIRAVQRWSLNLKDATGRANERDRIWSFLIAAAYLKEAIDGLLRQNYPEIVRLARKDGTPEEVITRIVGLMSKKPQGLYTRLLANARNNLVFHWEEATFARWVENYDGPTVEWAMGTGETDGEIVFSSATLALLNSLIPGASDSEIRSRVGEVVEASGLLVGVFQRAIHAFVQSSPD
jgi:hypothetical protein